jgi:hypothetical protein
MLRICVLVFVSILFFTSCNKRKIKKVENFLIDGSWKVQSFLDDNEDKTDDFNGMVFTFKADGVVALTGSISINGTWDVAKENDGNDDDLSDDKHIELILNIPYPFDNISDDWEIDNYSDSKIELKDVSGDGSEETLILIKN